MTVYAVMCQKGGVGKTTLSMNLAAGLARRGTGIVIDADPQGSATMWSTLGSEHPFPLEVVNGAQAPDQELARHQGRFDFIVMDCPPASEFKGAEAVASNAQVLLIPVLPSPMDLWASVGIEAMINRARERNPGVRAFVVMNQMESRNAMSRHLEAALAEMSIPALRSALSRRAAYRTAALEGCSVYDLGPRGEAAVDEIEAVINEVQEELNK